ncbi:MAG: hypothetical protein J6X53_03360 [Abditibacteriota bacterium]|nr:hypothetical protein [Abditibacteriota bacterium]
MKKLISVLAVFAMVCGAASADVTMTDWVLWSNEDFDYVDTYTEDYAPAGFDIDTTGVNWGTTFACESMNVGGWLYNGNDSFTITFEGFEDEDFVWDDEAFPGLLRAFFTNPENDAYVEYGLSWEGPGTYTFTAEDITDSYGSFEGKNVDMFTFDGFNPEFGYSLYILSGADGRITVSVDTREPETPETVVPEPACAAYGITGLVSLIGIKRRIKK